MNPFEIFQAQTRRQMIGLGARGLGALGAASLLNPSLLNAQQVKQVTDFQAHSMVRISNPQPKESFIFSFLAVHHTSICTIIIPKMREIHGTEFQTVFVMANESRV